jgi:hypothetical protein
MLVSFSLRECGLFCFLKNHGIKNQFKVLFAFFSEEMSTTTIAWASYLNPAYTSEERIQNICRDIREIDEIEELLRFAVAYYFKAYRRKKESVVIDEILPVLVNAYKDPTEISSIRFGILHALFILLHTCVINDDFDVREAVDYAYRQGIPVPVEWGDEWCPFNNTHIKRTNIIHIPKAFVEDDEIRSNFQSFYLQQPCEHFHNIRTYWIGGNHDVVTDNAIWWNVHYQMEQSQQQQQPSQTYRLIREEIMAQAAQPFGKPIRLWRGQGSDVPILALYHPAHGRNHPNHIIFNRFVATSRVAEVVLNGEWFQLNHRCITMFLIEVPADGFGADVRAVRTDESEILLPDGSVFEVMADSLPFIEEYLLQNTKSEVFCYRIRWRGVVTNPRLLRELPGEDIEFVNLDEDDDTAAVAILPFFPEREKMDIVFSGPWV